jgi:hypothetical protein
MSGWKLAEMTSYPTDDPRIRIANFSPGQIGNWRTMVQDEPGPEWEVTGPPWQTRKAAEAAISDVRAYYFGDEPTRAELIARIDAALAIARQNSGYRQVARMVEALNGQSGG